MRLKTTSDEKSEKTQEMAIKTQEMAMKAAASCENEAVDMKTPKAPNVESDMEAHPCHSPPHLRQMKLAQREHPAAA